MTQLNEIHRTGDEDDQYNTVLVPHETATSPREDFEGFWSLAILHKKVAPTGPDDVSSADKLEELRERDDIIRVTLYLYDHSAYKLSTTPFSDPWESSQIGFAFARKSAIKESYGADETGVEKAYEDLKGELNEYETYLNGDIYDLIIEQRQSCGHHHEIETIGMLYGYEYAIEQAETIHAERNKTSKITIPNVRNTGSPATKPKR